MFKYLPHTENDLQSMYRALNIAHFDELYQDIPADVRYHGDYHLPSAMSESELRSHFKKLAAMNTQYTVFAGLGAYDHYDPAVIGAITSRQEFLTSYTPYQPEVAQGTLQYIFEYQTMVSSLTGMQVSNASMYDGPTAAAEAMFMAEAITKRDKILVSGTMSPHVLAVLKTYAKYKNLKIETIPSQKGIVTLAGLKALINDTVAGVFVQKPNFFGIIETYDNFAETIHSFGAVLIEYADISALAVLKTPKEDGADIACGDCQTLGMPLAFGGPYLGYLATDKPHVRKMPGRIVGMSYDKNGKRAFVLTLQAREQHIRREKANSNICSNQSLMALYVTIYTSIMGPVGLQKVNELSYQGAHYLHDALLKTGKFVVAFPQPFLKEFVLTSLIPANLLQKALQDAGFFGGLPLSEYGEEYRTLVNFAVTEKRTKAEIDLLVKTIGGLTW